MTQDFNHHPGSEAELGRSPSGASDPDAARGTPSHAAPHGETPGVEFVKDPQPESEALDDTHPSLDDTDTYPRDEDPVRPPPLTARRRGSALRKKEAPPARKDLTPEGRLLILDTWNRSGLPAGDFSSIVGISKHTLYAWKRRFSLEGPAGLLDRAKGPGKGSKLPELTRRTILLLKSQNPEFGCERISALLVRGPALPASPGAVARVLKEAGYVSEEVPTRPHPDKPREFERARPNELWQSDLFTFVLKRQNRRVHLVAFLDDHSRFLVAYGLHATQSSALVIEVLRSGIASYQSPREVLTDNGAQYITWRGKGAFTRECEKRGIEQIVAKPRRPQTLGKIERFYAEPWIMRRSRLLRPESANVLSKTSARISA